MINVILRASNILECLSEGINGVVEISEKVNLHKATVHRILKSLEESGIVVQEPHTRKYYLGPLIFRLSANSIVAHQGLIACAFETMWKLRDLTSESVALQIPKGSQRLILEELESRESFRFTLGREYMAPLYTGSGGIIMLTQYPEDDLSTMFENVEFLQIGPGTIRNKDELMSEVKKARMQGYAVSISTEHVGTAGISVPIENYVCPAALSAFGPESRLDYAMSHIEEIKKSGCLISQKLEMIFKKTKGGSEYLDSII